RQQVDDPIFAPAASAVSSAIPIGQSYRSVSLSPTYANNTTNGPRRDWPLSPALRLRRQPHPRSPSARPIPRLVSGPSYRDPQQTRGPSQPPRRFLTAAHTLNIYTSDPARIRSPPRGTPSARLEPCPPRRRRRR